LRLYRRLRFSFSCVLFAFRARDIRPHPHPVRELLVIECYLVLASFGGASRKSRRERSVVAIHHSTSAPSKSCPFTTYPQPPFIGAVPSQQVCTLLRSDDLLSMYHAVNVLISSHNNCKPKLIFDTLPREDGKVWLMLQASAPRSKHTIIFPRIISRLRVNLSSSSLHIRRFLGTGAVGPNPILDVLLIRQLRIEAFATWATIPVHRGVRTRRRCLQIDLSNPVQQVGQLLQLLGSSNNRCTLHEAIEEVGPTFRSLA
jgi:hypothetical protein